MPFRPVAITSSPVIDCVPTNCRGCNELITSLRRTIVASSARWSVESSRAVHLDVWFVVRTVIAQRTIGNHVSHTSFYIVSFMTETFKRILKQKKKKNRSNWRLVTFRREKSLSSSRNSIKNPFSQLQIALFLFLFKRKREQKNDRVGSRSKRTY